MFITNYNHTHQTCAQTDVAFILKVASGAVIPRIWAQLRLRAVVSFTASFSLTKKRGEQQQPRHLSNARVRGPTSARVQHHPQQHATQQGPLHPRPGVAHATVGVSLHTSLACKLPPVRSPAAKTSHLTVRLMSDQLGGRMQPAAGPCYDRGFQLHARRWLSVLITTATSRVCFSRLQLGTANIVREEASNVFPPPPMADSCSGTSRYLAGMPPGALWKRAARRKRRSAVKQTHKSLAVIFLFAADVAFPSVWLPNGGSAHSPLNASVVNPLLPHGCRCHWTRVTVDP